MKVPTREFDRKGAEAFAWQTSQQIAAAMNCTLSHVGDQLDLYRTLEANGPCTSRGLAEITGLNERWLREWLRHQATVNQLDYDAPTDKFSISPEAAAVLCDTDNPLYFASGFSAFASLRKAAEDLPNVFRTGIGWSYEDHGPSCACAIESLNNFVPRFLLVPKILAEIKGLHARLERGIKVADVGCGSGIALMNMARAFPESRFIGYEISEHALSRFKQHLKQDPLANVEIYDVRDERLPEDGSFDFICTFDVIHDLPFPEEMIAAIRASLSADGVWLCSDIRSLPTFEENLNENPQTALMFGFSLLVCLSSAMSQPGGRGLGTLGFNEDVAREMTREAGFSHFRKLDYENASNSYYEIRP